MTTLDIVREQRRKYNSLIAENLFGVVVLGCVFYAGYLLGGL